MPPRRVTRSTAKEPATMVNQTARQSVAPMFLLPTKRSTAELDDEVAPVKLQKETKRARKPNAIPENQSDAEDVAIAAPRVRGRRKAAIPKDMRQEASSAQDQTKVGPPKTATKGRGKKVQFEKEKPEAIKPGGISPLPSLFISLEISITNHH